MRKRNSDLEAMLRPVVADLGYEFWGLERLTEKGGSLLRLYIDSAAGITLADCERVSYRVAGVLDVEDPHRRRLPAGSLIARLGQVVVHYGAV